MTHKKKMKDLYTKAARQIKTRIDTSQVGDKLRKAADYLMLTDDDSSTNTYAHFEEFARIIELLGMLKEPYKSQYRELHTYCIYISEKMENEPTTYQQVYTHYEQSLSRLREYLELKVIHSEVSTEIPLDVQRVLVELLKTFTTSVNNTVSTKKPSSAFETREAVSTQRERELAQALSQDVERLNRKETALDRYNELRNTFDTMLGVATPEQREHTLYDTPPSVKSPFPPKALVSDVHQPIGSMDLHNIYSPETEHQPIEIVRADTILEDFKTYKNNLEDNIIHYSPEEFGASVENRSQEIENEFPQQVPQEPLEKPSSEPPHDMPIPPMPDISGNPFMQRYKYD